ncbi:MAG: YebC/PmpR family DNA-binding transcriptional regulator [Parcubacteria group bacterium]|jgi:YebC/PmpR family DNA-binding regulatory protein
MSGHSHWAGIKHRKGLNDAKKANIFTKMGRLITIAAREGGGDLATNFKLKMVADKARSVNMPKDNIERAIKRGTGELKDGSIIEEVIYEAYGPVQVPMLIKTATDNKNRTFGEVRGILTKGGGKTVPEGSVGYLFNQVGEIEIKADGIAGEELELKIIESGADDFQIEEEGAFVYTKVAGLKKVKEFLEKEGLEILSAELTFIATQKSEIPEADREKYEALLEKLDENDDVVEIYDNLK